MAAFIFNSALRQCLSVLPVLLALAADPVEATVFTVGAAGGDPACTLADAITAAIINTQTGGCPAGSADDTDIIELTGDVILTEALPEVRSYCSPEREPYPCAESVQTRITINGHGHSIARPRDPDTPEFDLLTIFTPCGEIDMPAPIIKLNEVELKHGRAGISLEGGTRGTYCLPDLELVNSRITDNDVSVRALPC
ncbi:hypothetical protein ACWJKU_02700 [Methylocaldum sp. MU1018]